ncbi:histone acetyltransferase KAT2B-like [Rhopalosiphum maidis]|uniref:histone acetyltransferase KAT2B-like n=1 Tax=Rhopalosiphum maidis TaxID=43146 RepID=UPI000EFE5A5C|nr:histone acetyltransferase KAT2B-like [Rhopalosiphum maidis]
MSDINETIKSFRQREKVVVMYSRMEKLAKISNYMPCRMLRCVCHGWICDEKTKKAWMNSHCANEDCKHELYDHVSHLVNASENMLNALIRLINDFENIRDEIEYLSMLPTDDERDFLLKKCKDFIYHEIKNFISPDSLISYKDSIETPPFESPTIVEILKNFCLYKFLPNLYHLKVAFKITKIILKNFDQWIWYMPEELLYFNKLQYNNSYDYYYQRYRQNCLTLNAVQSIVKPSYTSSMIFGQDVLRYTLKVFRISFTKWCLNESENCSFSKKCLFIKILPKFLDLLEQEVYTVDSPIWNLNYMNTSLPKRVLDNLNSKLNELIQNQLNAAIMNSKKQGRIYKNRLIDGVVLQISDEKYNNNCVLMDNLLNTFENIYIDIGPSTSLKGFITDQNKYQTQANGLGIEMIVFDCESNFTKCVLCRKELRNMYHTRLPRLPDMYIARLETDKQIQTLAMLEDGVPVGGIYFCTFNSQGFTEIILCMFKVDLHVNGYESCLMNYLKDYHIQHKIWNLLVYADKETFEYFKSQKFSSEVKISKTKYNKYITHYEDSKLMYCNLKKK